MSLNELNNGFFKDGDIYFQCINGCYNCSNFLECNTCKTGYYKSNNNKCFLIIENCSNYDEEGKCTECILGYEIIVESNK